MTITTFPTVKKQTTCRLHSKTNPAEINLDSLSEVFSALPGVSILGGNSSKENADGFSYWMASPKEVFEFRAGQTKPLEKLQRILNMDSRGVYPAHRCGRE